MMYETNIFKIENLQVLSAQYSLFEILGLKQSAGDDDYEINIQYIIRTLSYSLKHPVTVITRDGRPFLVVRTHKEILERVPEEYPIKRNDLVRFKKSDSGIPLDFINYTDETKAIISRFLQFDIQTELNKDFRIWQPESGGAFFNTDASVVVGNVGVYNGFLVRVVELPVGKGFGIAIDVTKKYMSEVAEKIKMSRAEFKKMGIDKSHLVYNYGGKRYEIKAHQISDLNAGQYKFPRRSDGEFVTLLEDTQESFKRASGTMPPEVANLPEDASVLMYMTKDKEERGVIAGLCYRVFDTEDKVVASLHRKSIIKPFNRRRLIRGAKTKFVNALKFGTLTLQINDTPIKVAKKKFIAPDIEFGNDVSVSIRRTNGAIATSIEQLGRQRIASIEEPSIGFYSTGAFDAQYFVVPETLHNMYCNKQYFLKDLMTKVNEMHKCETGWDPEVITYNTRGKKNSVDIGFEILQKIKERVGKNKGGYAIVLLPSDVERIKRKHDETAALIVAECQDIHELQVSIMHSDTLDECFLYKSGHGQSKYIVKNDMFGKYKGYVRGVAINQVLLNNERWPYVLKTPLHADLTIGIDVKRHIAGFTFIDKYSRNTFTRSDKSDNKERLSTAQVIKMLVKWIPLQAKYATTKLRSIVIHRDGRLFPREQAGIDRAIEALKQKGILSSDATVSIVEIPKNSMAPYRLFDIINEYNVLKTYEDNNKTLNPEIGSWIRLNTFQALLCTTGREFRRNGSSRPLLVNYTQGSGLPVDEIMEDLYHLSTLAYTKPDDCSRLPLTLKLTDRKINNLGSEADFESLEILKIENY